ncbi:hypothetical protein TeGR_g659 [Tetraparma gracilis]|uniref:Guanylate cyclase domain-containing protein n=1 Tax=Tetraparma gracilis TaxID=2962635 RepID=A0ABQ6MA57_9STRA|nr:hypothetical protein TeGR_g659 [Tetraparma gracilis]
MMKMFEAKLEEQRQAEEKAMQEQLLLTNDSQPIFQRDNIDRRPPPRIGSINPELHASTNLLNQPVNAAAARQAIITTNSQAVADSALSQLREREKNKEMATKNMEFSVKLSAQRNEIEALKAQLVEVVGGDGSQGSKSKYKHGMIDLLLILQPNMVINNVAAPAYEPKPHFSVHKGVTVLFADISGYTALAQTLGAAGAAGTELLSKSLDDFFGIAITSIYRFNGDVIKFCGDAILCVFEPDRNSTPADSALAAVLCAMELKAKLRNFKAAEGVMLDLKLMIGHGEIVGNYVGDSALNHFEFLVTGQPMDQMTQAEHYVVPGDIIMSKEAHAIVEDSVVVKDVNPQAAAFGFKLLVGTTPSFVPPVAPPPSIPVRLSANRQRLLEMFNESTIVEKLDGIAGSWTRLERSSSSLRSRVSRHDLCTILFINMSSDKISSESNEEVLEGLNEAFMAFYHPTKLFQGTLRQFLLDDKGMVAIIVFSGRESNTISACRCSLKIQENFTSNDIEANIGIATGKVFFGPVGDERRCEMAWIGDSVNLAARLMGKAEDTIFVDKATCENASSELSFEMHGMVELKGKGAVTIYELLGLKHRGSVLMEGRRRSSVSSEALLSRPAVFDNAASVLSAISVEACLGNARKKEAHSHRKAFDREAICFCLSISRRWTSTDDEYR